MPDPAEVVEPRSEPSSLEWAETKYVSRRCRVELCKPHEEDDLYSLSIMQQTSTRPVIAINTRAVHLEYQRSKLILDPGDLAALVPAGNADGEWQLGMLDQPDHTWSSVTTRLEGATNGEPLLILCSLLYPGQTIQQQWQIMLPAGSVTVTKAASVLNADGRIESMPTEISFNANSNSSTTTVLASVGPSSTSRGYMPATEIPRSRNAEEWMTVYWLDEGAISDIFSMEDMMASLPLDSAIESSPSGADLSTRSATSKFAALLSPKPRRVERMSLRLPMP